ncbi:hypothetical protein [Hymenobacter sp.]|uniref:nuclear transport factor 2 family protein n=1 Tax=Hymenobacter sp. TaxID=1898978 RepID=UPI00286A603E|nr:hypothetical protein [Hymenobacter sp.]
MDNLIALVHQYQAAAYSGDVAAAGEFLSDQVTLTLAGNNQLSGVYLGGDAFFGAFGRMMEITAGTYRLAQEYDSFSSPTRAVFLVQEQATRDGHDYVYDRVVEFIFDGPRILAVRVYEGNPEVVDVLFK